MIFWQVRFRVRGGGWGPWLPWGMGNEDRIQIQVER